MAGRDWGTFEQWKAIEEARRCAVEGCLRKRRVKGWCKLHYNRVWRTGDVGPVGLIDRGPRSGQIEAAAWAVKKEGSYRGAARVLGVDYATVVARLKKYSPEFAESHHREHFVSDAEQAEMVRRYSDGESSSGIGRAMRKNRGTVKAVLNRAGVPMRSSASKDPLLIAKGREESAKSALIKRSKRAAGVIRVIERERTMQVASRILGMDRETVKRILEESGRGDLCSVERGVAARYAAARRGSDRRTKEAAARWLPRLPKIRRMRRDGWSFRAIGEEFGVNNSTIQDVLRRADEAAAEMAGIHGLKGGE